MSRIAGLLFFPFLLNGCFWQNDEDGSEPDRIRLTPATVVMWEAGQQTQLQASIVNSDQQPYKVQPGFGWRSSNQNIATVDANGLVQAHSEGEAVISVSAKGLSQTARVVVTRDAPLLQGKVLYEDRIQTRSGFNGETRHKPVRHTLVDLLDSGGRLLQSVWTDADGYYRFAIVDPGPFRLRVLATSGAGVASEVNVADLSGRIYALGTVPGGDYTVDQDVVIDLDSGFAGVFNILDVMTAGGQFVSHYSLSRAPPLNVFWQAGNQNGTYYCSGPNSVYCAQGGGIYIYSRGPGGDTDEFDDDVLWHEYSHFLSDNLSRDDSPGGCHVLSANDLDLRLSWSEGWGDFFPAAIKRWLLEQPELAGVPSITASTPSSLYVDTAGNYAQISIDIDRPGARPFVYAANELAVSKVLLELNKQFGMSFIWQAFEHGLPAAGRQVNLEVFWDSLFAQHGINDYQRTVLEDIFAEREIYYRWDAFEPDRGDSVQLLHDVSQSRHLYQDSVTLDQDTAFFSAKQGERWQLETFWLSNGADTVIDVLDPAGKLVAQNNDANPGAYYSYDYVCGGQRVRNNDSALSSKVVVEALTTGNYKVRIRPHAGRAAAGRYGSYTLRARRL